jgi:vacuolar-type H+-ATPase subunit F/Vma7
MRAFVVGNDDCVLGFALVGVRGTVAGSGAEVDAALAACQADRSIGLVLISRDVADLSRDRVDQMKVGYQRPIVVEIPASAYDAGGVSLYDFVQRMIGIRLGGAR